MLAVEHVALHVGGARSGWVWKPVTAGDLGEYEPTLGLLVLAGELVAQRLDARVIGSSTSFASSRASTGSVTPAPPPRWRGAATTSSTRLLVTRGTLERRPRRDLHGISTMTSPPRGIVIVVEVDRPRRRHAWMTRTRSSRRGWPGRARVSPSWRRRTISSPKLVNCVRSTMPCCSSSTARKCTITSRRCGAPTRATGSSMGSTTAAGAPTDGVAHARRTGATRSVSTTTTGGVLLHRRARRRHAGVGLHPAPAGRAPSQRYGSSGPTVAGARHCGRRADQTLERLRRVLERLALEQARRAGGRDPRSAAAPRRARARRGRGRRRP